MIINKGDSDNILDNWIPLLLSVALVNVEICKFSWGFLRRKGYIFQKKMPQIFNGKLNASPLARHLIPCVKNHMPSSRKCRKSTLIPIHTISFLVKIPFTPQFLFPYLLPIQPPSCYFAFSFKDWRWGKASKHFRSAQPHFPWEFAEIWNLFESATTEEFPLVQKIGGLVFSGSVKEFHQGFSWAFNKIVPNIESQTLPNAQPLQQSPYWCNCTRFSWGQSVWSWATYQLLGRISHILMNSICQFKKKLGFCFNSCTCLDGSILGNEFFPFK